MAPIRCPHGRGSCEESSAIGPERGSAQCVFLPAFGAKTTGTVQSWRFVADGGFSLVEGPSGGCARLAAHSASSRGVTPPTRELSSPPYVGQAHGKRL